MADLSDDGLSPWGRAQEAALREELAAARAELEEAHRVDDGDAVFRAQRRWGRAIALVGDRVVVLEAEGAGEIAEVRHQLAWHEETSAAVRRALAAAGDVERTLRWAASRLAEAAPEDGLDDVGAALAEVDDHLAHLATTTRRIGLVDRGTRVPPVAWSPPTGRTEVLGLAVDRADPDEVAAALADGRQRVAATLSWVQTLQALLADRRTANDAWDELARQRLEHLVLAHVADV